MTLHTPSAAGQDAAYTPTLYQRLMWRLHALLRPWYALRARFIKSKLEVFAEEELRRAGFYSPESDYGGMIPAAVLDIVKVFGRQGHSGGSAWVVRGVLSKILAWKPLTPITSDPSEWMSVSEYYGPNSKRTWQNRRCSSCFSEDGGKTYYDIDDNLRPVHVSMTPRP